MPSLRDMRSPGARIAILVLVGMLVSAQQARPESVFGGCRPRAAAPPEMRVAAPSSPPTSAALADTLGFSVVDEDTLETFDVVIEEEKDRSALYKEIAAFAIAAAMVSYFVITLIAAEEEEEPEPRDGRPIPTSIEIPIIR